MTDPWQFMETTLVGFLGTLREAQINNPYEDDLTPTERRMIAERRKRLLYDATKAMADVRKRIRKVMP